MPKHIPDMRVYYRRLRSHFGHQHWWPADTPFEVCVGAILTQNTAWSNVERAIRNLKQARLLTPRALYATPTRRLAALIRPAGYFNVKAKRLRHFLSFLMEQYHGDLDRMLARPTNVLRAELLEVNGIGPETADSILLYAGNHPVFVVDAYTKRVLARHAVISSGATYDDIQRLFPRSLHRDPVAWFNDFHAQFVAVGKTYCRARAADCACCPLRSELPRKVRTV